MARSSCLFFVDTICESNPCQNGGSCKETKDNRDKRPFKCSCTEEYIGVFCQERSMPPICLIIMSAIDYRGKILKNRLGIRTICDSLTHNILHVM